MISRAPFSKPAKTTYKMPRHKYKKRFCLRCPVDFRPTTGNQRYCVACTDRERFKDKVVFAGVECWLWQGARFKNGGYGQFREYRKRNSARAHVFAWRLWRGAVPAGLYVLHKCDNPPCVNPNHLFLGTAKDNSDDCGRKGRNGTTRHPEIVRGARNGMAKLTDGAVRAIRKSTSKLRVAAKCYGVSESTISRIRLGKTWRHVA